MMRLRATHAGLVDLRISVNVKRGLETLAGQDPKRICSN
jgi:hypothetical protein